MYILGINAYHAGASACLIRDGVLVAAVEEERFRRVKYWAVFPTLAIHYCLAVGGITPAELDHVGISRDPGAHLHSKALYAPRRRRLAGRCRRSMGFEIVRPNILES
jgi:carbamoyltransferase